VTGKRAANCWIALDSDRDAIIIDPGDDGDHIARYVEKEELSILAILGTHAHHDHIGAAGMLKSKFSTPFFLHSSEARLLKTANFYRRLFDKAGPVAVPDVDVWLDHVTTPVQLGGFDVHVLSTPGHTKGSVSFLIEDYLFTGDTLLTGKTGRVDLPGGDETALRKSLRMLAALPGTTRICPGHGGASTISLEKQHNTEFLRALEG
jgi:glyoxylase-like metal-dependent hydrolase (beta-lactamase superfamily II)